MMKGNAIGVIYGRQIVNLSQNRDYIVAETPEIGNKLISRDLIVDLRFPEKLNGKI